jgi:hypothetical protein
MKVEPTQKSLKSQLRKAIRQKRAGIELAMPVNVPATEMD